MRGDQLTRLWRVVRATEASPNRLTVAEIAKREETGIRTIYRDLEALQGAGLPLSKNLPLQAVSYLYQIQPGMKNTLRKVDLYEAWFYKRTIYLIGLSHLQWGGADFHPGPNQDAPGVFRFQKRNETYEHI